MSDDSNLKANLYSIEEEDEIYNLTMDAILSNTRWYLDNLEKMPTYRVSWHRYNSKKHHPVTPMAFCHSKESKNDDFKQ